MMMKLLEFRDIFVKEVAPSLSKIIQKEISVLVLKILLGIIISSTFIFSIFQLTVYYVSSLNQNEDMIIYPFIIFGLVIISCIISLYYIFKTTEKKISPDKINKPASLLLIFSQGFIEGFYTEKKTQQ